MAADLNALNGRTPPRMPFWWFIIQIVTLVLALAVFIASAYAIHHSPGGGPQAFLLFDCLMVFIFVGGFLAIERFQPAWYFRIIFIVSYALLIIFLLSAWAWAASVAGYYLGASWCFRGECWGTGVGAALAVGAAFGAVMWVLMIVSLVFYIMACLRDGNGDVATANATHAEMGAVKTEQPTTVAPDQQQYPQQPLQQQQPYPDTPYGQDQQQYPPQQPLQQQQQPYNP